jgi:hypothetical protein
MGGRSLIDGIMNRGTTVYTYTYNKLINSKNFLGKTSDKIQSLFQKWCSNTDISAIQMLLRLYFIMEVNNATGVLHIF